MKLFHVHFTGVTVLRLLNHTFQQNKLSKIHTNLEIIYKISVFLSVLRFPVQHNGFWRNTDKRDRNPVFHLLSMTGGDLIVPSEFSKLAPTNPLRVRDVSLILVGESTKVN